eukprot:10898146-Prorocentrum_lima.AAC.1
MPGPWAASGAGSPLSLATLPLACCHAAMGATSRSKPRVLTPSPPIFLGRVAKSHWDSVMGVPASHSQPDCKMES